MYLKHVSTLIPEQERMALVRASMIEDILERIVTINEITEKCRKKYPRLFWTTEEEIAIAKKLGLERAMRGQTERWRGKRVMSKHTSGEWDIATINGGQDDDEIVSMVNGCMVNIATVFGPCEYSEARPNGKDEPHYEVTREEAAGNALLLAAAPKLLAALDQLLSYYIIDGEPSTLPILGPKDHEILEAWNTARATVAMTGKVQG